MGGRRFSKRGTEKLNPRQSNCIVHINWAVASNSTNNERYYIDLQHKIGVTIDLGTLFLSRFIGADLMVQKVREIFSYMLDDNLVATVHSWSKRKDYIGKEATRSEDIEMQIQSSFFLLLC